MQIKLSNVYFSYNKKIDVLKNINTIFSDNEIVSIIGKTGSGKSTLIQLLNGLLIPDKGSVTIDDFEVSKTNKKNLKKLGNIRKDIGIVFQYPEYQLFEETVLKDVMFGPKNFGLKDEDAEKAAKEALLTVGLNDSYFERSPFELSGGQKRKVAIAGILAFNPKVVIFDEPTVGLDKKSKDTIISIIKKLHDEGKMIILVTHDMEVVNEIATRVLVLANGEIAIDKSKEELFKMDDLEKYSIDYPFVYKFINELKNKGCKKDFSNVHNIDELIKVLGDKNG